MHIFRSDQRGTTQTDWLTSRHSFSFGNFYADDRNGFSALKAINEDEVAPETGFPTHSHRDMEILSYVLAGEIAHKDSEGNVVRLPAGEFQLMSAGTGIRHSELNPLAARKLHFLQIWITPNQLEQPPGYQQRRFARAPGMALIASPDGADGSLQLRQDARIFRLLLAADEQVNPRVVANRHYYVQLISGRLHVEADGQRGVLDAGDGAALANIAGLCLRALEGDLEALVFDLP